jgi:hypothetical protein
MASFKAADGKTVTEGKAALVLRHGDTERKVKGTVRAFEPHTEQIADLEAKLEALRADNVTRWEIATADATIGFLPENVLSRTD